MFTQQIFTQKIFTQKFFLTNKFFTESVRLSFVDLRWAQLYVSLVHSQLPFYLDKTNLQAAFDKLIFVELAIFVDIKLVEHHLRILLCSVLEKCTAGGVVKLKQEMWHHIIWDKVTLEIPSIS